MSTAEISSFAAGLARLGVTRGVSIALLAGDRPEVAPVRAAARQLGAGVIDDLSESYVQLAVCDATQLDAVLAARARATVRHVVCLGGGDPRALSLAELRDVGYSLPDPATEEGVR